jgi:hypothetical protein
VRTSRGRAASHVEATVPRDRVQVYQLYIYFQQHDDAEGNMSTTIGFTIGRFHRGGISRGYSYTQWPLGKPRENPWGSGIITLG